MKLAIQNIVGNSKTIKFQRGDTASEIHCAPERQQKQ